MKYVADNEYLLKKNTITVNDKKNVSNEVNAYLSQHPNTLVAGIPFALGYYNRGDKNYPKTYEKWRDSFPKMDRFLTRVFSKKQARRYYQSKYNSNQRFFENGEAPVILDSSKTKITATNLQQHFINKGYFKTKITYDENYKSNKRATVEYNINTGEIFLIDSISRNIKSPVLDSIYELHKSESLIKKGGDFNYKYFDEEADRITKLFRNSGIYHFIRNDKLKYLNFGADTTKNTYNANITLNIKDRTIKENDTTSHTIPYKIQKIATVDVYTDYTFSSRNEPYTITENYNNVTFHGHDVLKYNSKFLTDAIFIAPNTIYKDEDRNLTRKHLRGLQNFRSVKIEYEELNNDRLATKIYLTPYKKYSFAIKNEITHSNIKQLGLSGNISLLNKNIFKGAEILQFSVQGSFFDTSQDNAASDRKLLDAWEFGGDISLEIPRIIFPISTKNIIPKTMSPKTSISLGTSFQKNIGLDKQRFTGIIDYNWVSSKTKSHRLELINAQYIQNLNSSSYFNIYRSEFNDLKTVSEIISENTTIPTDNFDNEGNLIPLNFIDFITNTNNEFQNTDPVAFKTVQNIEKRRNIITENTLIPAISYQYTYNNSESYKDINFSFFRARIASSGALTSALSKKSSDNGKKEILDIPIAQYLKLDLEYKKFWSNYNNNILAFRSLVGIAIPYGNSNDIPFSRSYFIGGANDLRAWKIYDLGPGSISNGLEYNVGSLKILTSLEYRFKVLNNIKGAIFIDAGNIWDITNSDITGSKGKFSGLKSLKDIAIGSGFGVRYDFSFLVLRLDLGFKTYEPYQPEGQKWFQNYNFGHAVYNIGINYPF